MSNDKAMVLVTDPHKERYLQDLRILARRIKMIGDRYGLKPYPAYFTLKSDQQVLDDIIYAGLPRHYKHWRYGKQAVQSRSGGRGGHVFEFALNSNPAEIALGSTNDLVMQILVMVHAWMGHVQLDANNAWFRESEASSVIQKFARDERFVDALLADPKWGPERYNYYMDAAHALETHCGWLPTNRDVIPDGKHRRMLEDEVEKLEAAWRLAATDADRAAIEDDIKDNIKQRACHPIVPTDDLLAFLMDGENTPHLPDEVHVLLRMVRDEYRYHQAFMRTRYMHEGFSHWVDSKMPWEPELDMLGLGWSKLLDNAIYATMHDSYPIYWYHDVYAFGLAMWNFIDETTSRKLPGFDTVRYKRLKLDEDGHVVETDEEVEKQVERWDRSFMYEVMRTYNDRRFFETFINDDFMARLNKKALEWVRRMMAQINKILRDKQWNSALIFDPIPETLEDMYLAIQTWYTQVEMSQWIGQWWGYGAPPFPIHPMVLQQMLQIIETVASWDQDKHAYKRQMLLYTDMSFVPNIRLVDTGRFSKTGMWTLRHEYDPDFGPLAQSDCRETLRRFWRFAGQPCQFLTWEQLTDDFGRPWGPPRPYRYYTENGRTVKEQWL